MSKKSVHDCIKEYEKTAFTVSRSEAMQFAWNFCASQYEKEAEGLKLKFSEATKTYTDDIDKLEKENDELKKKLDEAVLIMSDLKKEKAFACESFICDSCPMTCYDIKTKRLKMFISINKEHVKGVKGEF